MRTDCKHYESRTYQSGDVVRKCRIDLAPEAPWQCPADCAGYERRDDRRGLVSTGRSADGAGAGRRAHRPSSAMTPPGSARRGREHRERGRRRTARRAGAAVDRKGSSARASASGAERARSMVDVRGARRRCTRSSAGRIGASGSRSCSGRPTRSSSAPATPTRWCSPPGGSGSRSRRSRGDRRGPTASGDPVMLRAAGGVARAAGCCSCFGAGAFFASAAGERVRGDRQDPPPGRDADRRAAAGRDHRRGGAVPRRARRAAGTSCFGARRGRRDRRSSRRRRRAAGPGASPARCSPSSACS